jgi:hypothetical protein
VRIESLRYLNLVAIIVVMMALSPFVIHYPSLRLLNNLVLILVMLAAVNTVKEHRSTLVTGPLLGIPWILLSWLESFDIVAVHPAAAGAAAEAAECAARAARSAASRYEEGTR